MQSYETIPTNTIHPEIIAILKGKEKNLEADSLRCLIPDVLDKIYGSENIGIVVRAGTDFGRLCYFLVEHNGDITDEHMTMQHTAFADRDKLHIDHGNDHDGYRLGRLTGEYYRKKVISDSDRVLMDVQLRLVNERVLFVDSFDAIRGQKIASDFYTNVLPRIAKAVGARLIAGNTSTSNSSFFTNKVGRVAKGEINSEGLDYIGLDLDEDATVLFLYPEDKEKYTNTNLT